jgi:hypothetical protein
MKVEIYFKKYFDVLIICFKNVKNMINFSNFEKKLGEKKKNVQQNIVLSKKQSSNDKFSPKKKMLH